MASVSPDPTERRREVFAGDPGTSWLVAPSASGMGVSLLARESNVSRRRN